MNSAFPCEARRTAAYPQRHVLRDFFRHALKEGGYIVPLREGDGSKGHRGESVQTFGGKTRTHTKSPDA